MLIMDNSPVYIRFLKTEIFMGYITWAAPPWQVIHMAYSRHKTPPAIWKVSPGQILLMTPIKLVRMRAIPNLVATSPAIQSTLKSVAALEHLQHKQPNKKNMVIIVQKAYTMIQSH